MRLGRDALDLRRRREPAGALPLLDVVLEGLGVVGVGAEETGRVLGVDDLSGEASGHEVAGACAAGLGLDDLEVIRVRLGESLQIVLEGWLRKAREVCVKPGLGVGHAESSLQGLPCGCGLPGDLQSG
jgi:hypothetical protein